MEPSSNGDHHANGAEFSDVEISKRDETKETEPQDSSTAVEPQAEDKGSSDVTENGNHESHRQEDNAAVNPPKANGYIPNIKPQAQFPTPEPPPEPKIDRSQSLSISEHMPSIGKYIRERSSSLSAAITKRLASLKDDSTQNGDVIVKNDYSVNFEVTEFKIPGVKVIVKLKSELEDLRGHITFFSKSNSRDCTAVRSFLRQKGLKFVEINIDVYPKREKELIERTGSAEVPQIFYNDKLLGGLVALNSLRNSGEFDKRLREVAEKSCAKNGPEPPAYGFDDDEEEKPDSMEAIVKVMRQTLPIQDRLVKMKLVKNCFSGAEMVEALIQHLDCGRRKAIATGKMLAQKHFIHHAFGENDFADGKHCYRFLEHEPFVMGSFNFKKCTNDSEPKSAAYLSFRLTKLMSAILESYASEDRCYLDYNGISKSEEFRRYLNLVQDLQRVNLQLLSPDERTVLFLNLYNAMVIHAVISIGHPEGLLDKRAFFCDFQYIVGGYPYSLNTIENGILRNNQRSPYSLIKPFGNGDRRLELLTTKVNPLIHFGLCNGTKSSPTVRFFTPHGVESELRHATREYFLKDHGIQIDLEKRTVHLTRIIKWFIVDFGQDKDVLKWVLNYLDATKSGLLTHLLSDGGPIHIVYQNYDWSGNCLAGGQ